MNTTTNKGAASLSDEQRGAIRWALAHIERHGYAAGSVYDGYAKAFKALLATPTPQADAAPSDNGLIPRPDLERDPLWQWRCIANEAEVAVNHKGKFLMLSEEMCVRLGTALEDASEPVIAPSVDAIATELWKAADACGFEQFREVARTAIAAGGAQEPVAEIYVWFAGNDGAERTGERFIRAWTDDPARVEGLRNAIGLEPTRFAPLPRVAATVPEGFALVPLKPNDAMQAAGAQAVRIDTTVLNRMWTANRVFRAMVEAAASNGGQ